MKTRKPKVWRYWCGFVDGHPDAAGADGDQYGGALYKSKSKAERGYDAVRRVEVREIPAKKKGRR